ncbi:MAG: hypothetical protein SGI84_09850 [Gemmatimonadota bacterium]|nr:hypothetical protein [Gemmatimonadota bacterium]
MSGIVQRFYSIALLGALATTACAAVEPSGPSLPALALRIEAPAHFRSWFSQTEACSGLSATFQTVEWYVVPGVNSFEVEGADRVGMWQLVEGKSQIVIAGNYLDHEMVVSHEILHHLLGREGHPNEMFVERCQLTWDTWALRQTPKTVAAR